MPEMFNRLPRLDGPREVEPTPEPQEARRVSISSDALSVIISLVGMALTGTGAYFLFGLGGTLLVIGGIVVLFGAMIGWSK